MIDPWRPMGDIAATMLCPVDLLIKSRRMRGLFRVPDCYLEGGQWFSRYYCIPLKRMGWRPVAWMYTPIFPSERELAACRAAK